jgi:hypothetical protein
MKISYKLQIFKAKPNATLKMQEMAILVFQNSNFSEKHALPQDPLSYSVI